MPKRSNRTIINFNVPRFTQISESHCGPAVIQMLLANLGIEVTQEQVAEAAGVKDLIEMNGTRVDQLALSVRRLVPSVRFWYKEKSSLGELLVLVGEYHYPVGVEWQGVFEDGYDVPEGYEDDTETGDSDYGHYSIVTQVNEKTRQLKIADPYKDYRNQERTFSFSTFESRWYDYNEAPSPAGVHPAIVEDYHMMFIITPGDEDFPRELGMRNF